jgi:hypothetical protein
MIEMPSWENRFAMTVDQARCQMRVDDGWRQTVSAFSVV